MPHKPTDQAPNPDPQAIHRVGVDGADDIVSPSDRATGHAYVQTGDDVETITLDEPDVEHAGKCVREHARQDNRCVTICLATAREVRQLRDELATHRCFTVIPVRIYDADSTGRRWPHTDVVQRRDVTPAEYAKALETFLDTFTVETDDGSISVRTFEARFRTWYRNLTAMNGLNRVWFGRLLAQQTSLKRTGNGQVLPDRRWID